MSDKFDAGDVVGCLGSLFFILGWLGFYGAVLYIAWHFISKYW